MEKNQNKYRKAVNYFNANKYQKVIKLLKDLELEEVEKEKSRLELLLRSYYYSQLSDKLDNYKKHRRQYLSLFKFKQMIILAEISSIKEIFDFEFDLICKKSQRKNLATLTEEIENLVDSFVLNSVLDSSRDIFLKLFHKNIFEQRYSLKNAIYKRLELLEVLSGIFFELTDDLTGYEKERAELMSLIADEVYFLQDQGEQKAINYLEKSLVEYPDNNLAERKIEKIKKLLLTKERAVKFEHDAGEKLSFLKDKTRLLMKKTDNKKIKSGLAQLSEQAEIIAGIFRLVRNEGPKFKFVKIDSLLEELVLSYSELGVDCLSFSGEKKKIELDKSYFIIAVDNLIKNSLDAYRRRGIEISSSPVRIHFDYDNYCCKVKDKAGGINEKLRKGNKLFELYASTKDSYQSSGLGLVQVKAAIELQGGEIKYKSDEQGTEFIIQLKK